MGECSKESAFAILDAFYDNGGNFIDTYVSETARILQATLTNLSICRSNNYQFEQAEQWLGEWMKARGNRDQIV